MQQVHSSFMAIFSEIYETWNSCRSEQIYYNIFCFVTNVYVVRPLITMDIPNALWKLRRDFHNVHFLINWFLYAQQQLI
jgi:hypothetical protein